MEINSDCRIMSKCYFDGTLLTQTGVNELTCRTCEEVFYDCHRCCDPDGLDWDVTEKGGFCVICKHHFCIGCYQRTGAFTPEDDSEYLCENCIKVITPKKYLRERKRKERSFV